MIPATRKIIQKRFGKIRIFPDGFRVSKALHRGGSGRVKPTVQEKPWGAEVWVIFTKRYAFKMLFIEKSRRFSLQRHALKEESWFVASGHPIVMLDKKKIQAKPGMIFHVRPGTVHRVESPKGLTEIWETSSPELHDAERLSDDFSRTSKQYNKR